MEIGQKMGWSSKSAVCSLRATESSRTVDAEVLLINITTNVEWKRDTIVW